MMAAMEKRLDGTALRGPAHSLASGYPAHNRLPATDLQQARSDRASTWHSTSIRQVPFPGCDRYRRKPTGQVQEPVVRSPKS